VKADLEAVRADVRRDIAAVASDADGALAKLEAAKADADAFAAKRLSAMKADYNAFSAFAERTLDSRIAVVRESLAEIAVAAVVRPVEAAAAEATQAVAAEVARVAAVEAVVVADVRKVEGAVVDEGGVVAQKERSALDAVLTWFRS
jgi:hypothetical protein